KSVAAGWHEMAATTALGFALGGLGLWCLASRPVGVAPQNSRQSWRQKLSLGCGAGVAALGLLKLAELLGGWNFGLDNFWFSEQSSVSGSARMSPSTALDFAL